MIPDGVYSEKVTTMYPIEVGAGVNPHYISIWWQKDGADTSTDKYVVNQTQFTDMESVFQETKITGLRLKYVPIGLVQSVTADLAVGPLYSASIVGSNATGPVGDEDLRNALDYKLLDSRRPFSRYYHVGRYAAG